LRAGRTLKTLEQDGKWRLAGQLAVADHDALRIRRVVRRERARIAPEAIEPVLRGGRPRPSQLEEISRATFAISSRARSDRRTISQTSEAVASSSMTSKAIF